MRRNILQSQSFINLGGSSVDTLVERCLIRHTPTGIKIGKDVRGAVLRNNVFIDVAQPLAGEGAAGALVLPASP